MDDIGHIPCYGAPRAVAGVGGRLVYAKKNAFLKKRQGSISWKAKTILAP
jgi:hypothetical protein